jgi:hypothetical protein
MHWRLFCDWKEPRRCPTLRPATALAGDVETTRIHRVAGLTGGRSVLVMTRPFRAPHHTISDVGLIGGGQVPKPGRCRWRPMARPGRVRWRAPAAVRRGLGVPS